MEYFLRDKCGTPQLAIEQETFEALRRSQQTLACALAVEEVYDMLITNLLDLESFLLSEATAATLRYTPPYDQMFQIRLGASTKLVNLLTVARMYVDQTPRKVAACFLQRKTALKTVKAMLTKEYDAHWQYRFMESLRNHVQHCGLPVHWTAQGGGWTSLTEDGRMERYVEIAALRESLSENTDFKKSVLAELDERIDLVLAARMYVERLSSVHAQVRAMLQEPLTTSRKEIESAHSRFGNADPITAVTLRAVASSADKVEEVPLHLTSYDLRKRLCQRNRELTNLHKSYVIGQARSQNT